MEGAGGNQMSPLDRAILLVVGLFLALLGLDVVASGLGWRGPGSVAVLLDEYGANAAEALIAGVVALLAGTYVCYLAVRQERDDGIRQETEMGHVRISLRAVENLVRRIAADVRGIKEVDVVVHPSPDGVAVQLFLVVNPEISIPVISEEVGRRVRSQVRETVGVSVGDVSVAIRNIVGATRPRVE